MGCDQEVPTVERSYGARNSAGVWWPESEAGDVGNAGSSRQEFGAIPRKQCSRQQDNVIVQSRRGGHCSRTEESVVAQLPMHGGSNAGLVQKLCAGGRLSTGEITLT